MMVPFRTLACVLLTALILVSCSSMPSPTPGQVTNPPPRLTPYTIQSPTMTPSATPIVTSTQEPLLPSPTPFTYTIQEGDTLFGLAIRFSTTVDDIVAANPDVDTTILSIGTELVIPKGEGDPAAQIPSPTPMPVKLDDPVCYPAEDGGLTCFLPATNKLDIPLENLSAVINVHKSNGEIATSKIAFPPLNILNPQESIPFLTHLPAPIPDPYQVFASLMTSLPSNEGRKSLEIITQDITFRLDHQLAEMEVEVGLNNLETPAQGKIWLVAVAWDKNGQVVGLRKRVHNLSDPSAKRVKVDLNLYSLGPPIQDIQVFTELH